MLLDELNGEMLHDAPILCEFLQSKPKNLHDRLVCCRILSRYSHDLTAKQVKDLKFPLLTGLNRKTVRAKRMIDRKEYNKAIALLEKDLDSASLYQEENVAFFSFMDDVSSQVYEKYYARQFPGTVMMPTIEDYGDAYFTIGLAYYYLNDDEAAEAALLKGKEWSPLHSEILRLLAAIKIGHKKYDIAKQYLVEALSFEMDEDCISNIYVTMSGMYDLKKKYEVSLVCGIIALYFNKENEDALEQCYYLQKRGYDLTEYPFDKVEKVMKKNAIPVGICEPMALAVFEACVELEENYPEYAEQYYKTLLRFGKNEVIERRLAHVQGDDDLYYEIDAIQLEQAILENKLGRGENFYSKILEGRFLLPLKESVPEDLLVDMQEAIFDSAEDAFMDEFRKYVQIEDYDHKRAIPLYTRKKKMEEDDCNYPTIAVRFEALLYLVSVLDIDLYINPGSLSEYYIDKREFNRINDELIHQLGDATVALLKANAEPSEANIHTALSELAECELLLPYNDVGPYPDTFERMMEEAYVVNMEDGSMALTVYTVEDCMNLEGNISLHKCDMEYAIDMMRAMDGVDSIIVNSESNAEMILDEDDIDTIEKLMNKPTVSGFLS